MKKILFLLFVIAFTQKVFSQKFEFQISPTAYKIAIEHSECFKSHYFYAYGEIYKGEDSWLYIQLFHEYNFLNKLSTHIEYRNFVRTNAVWQNIFIAGLSSPLYSNDFCYVGVSALYRYENAHLWQATATYGASYRILSFDGYMDVYGNKKANIFSENKLKIHFNKIYVGCNLEYMYLENTSYITPYIMVGLKL